MADIFTSQTGIRGQMFTGTNGTDYAGDNLFAGMWHLGQENLSKFDPYIKGYAFWIWTAFPKFLSVDSEFLSRFKALTERNFKSLSGLSDLSLDSDAITHGFAGNELNVPTNLKKDITTITMKHQELAGSPIRESIQHWVTGIRDPETGLATYHGRMTDSMRYSLMNHTAEGIYIVTDPSATKLGIEFAAYFTNMYPTKIPMDHLNFDQTDHGLSEIDVEYRCNFHQGTLINTLASSLMEKYIISRRYGDYGSAEIDVSKESSKTGESLNGFGPEVIAI